MNLRMRIASAGLAALALLAAPGATRAALQPKVTGNAHGVRCLTCDDLATRDVVQARVLSGEEEPPCRTCGGILKPTTVSFGEPMPRRPLARAEAAMRACDLVLVVGSTLIVHPAAGLPMVGVRSGAKLAIVNLTPTPLDDRATLTIRGKAGDVLPPAVARAAQLA